MRLPDAKHRDYIATGDEDDIYGLYGNFLASGCPVLDLAGRFDVAINRYLRPNESIKDPSRALLTVLRRYSKLSNNVALMFQEPHHGLSAWDVSAIWELIYSSSMISRVVVYEVAKKKSIRKMHTIDYINRGMGVYFL